MKSAEIFKAEVEHIRPIAENMREADKHEIWMSHQYEPVQALSTGFYDSHYAWTIMLEGKPIGMFGLGIKNALTGVGVPWLLGTDDMLRIRRQFIKESSIHVDFMQKICPHLMNFVHAENEASIRWLQSLGFELTSMPFEAGPFGALFYRFERHANV